MFPIFAFSLLQYLVGTLLFIVSLFLILLILVQRGRGGGLTGALGGMGGQSAFGSKAGDLFTRVTVVVAGVWIVLCLAILVTFRSSGFAPTGEAKRSAKAETTEPADAGIKMPPIDAKKEKSSASETNPATGSTEDSGGASTNESNEQTTPPSGGSSDSGGTSPSGGDQHDTDSPPAPPN